jgi:acyl-CoA reductase-like NAD-dependent aldehyde dehydrogenase
MTAQTDRISHSIDGRRTAGRPGRTVDVLNPSTGGVQAQVPMASAAEVDAAVAIAVAAQKGWAAFNPQRRARVMMRFVDVINKNIDELAELLSLEHGRRSLTRAVTSNVASRSSSSPSASPTCSRASTPKVRAAASTSIPCVSRSASSRASRRSTSPR